MSQGITLLFRSMTIGRFYSLVSAIGLAIAIGAVILVGALLHHETSYDRFYSGAERIYRLNWVSGGTGDRFATMFNPFAPAFAADTPDVQYAARVGTFEVLLEKPSPGGNQEFGNFELAAFVDPDFFRMFDLEFAAGSPDTALATLNSLVLTRRAAEMYFPGENVIGQTLLLEGNRPMTIAAVIEEMPANTHFPFHFIVPLEVVREIYGGASWMEAWGSDRLYHYVMLDENADPARLPDLLNEFASRLVPYENWDFEVTAQALADIHFTPDLQNEMPLRDSVRNILKTPRQRSDLTLFSAGALILVLIASFNFMNLQIARGFGRGRQIGLLKVVGASRYKVFERFLLESVLFAVAGLLLALMIVDLMLAPFSRTVGVSLSWTDVAQLPVMLGTLGLTLLLGGAAGAYPAWLMANQKPALILKGEFSHGHGVQRIRHVLVLLQFTVSIVLIALSLGINSQIRYSMSAPLGFDAAQAAVIAIDRQEARDDYESLRVRLLEHPDVVGVSQSSIVPTGNLSDGTTFDPDGSGPRDPVSVRLVSVDYEFFETLGIEMAAGRPFHREFGGEEFVFPSAEQPVVRTAIVLNEAAARRAGWDAQSAVGQEIRNDWTFNGINASVIMNVVGVANDVHFRSLRSEIVPMVYVLQHRGNHLVVKSRTADVESLLGHIDSVWRETVPEIPLRLEWLDDSVAQLYAQETRVLGLMAGVSIVGIGVACLGLFAVSSLVTESRRREVALRKVFGASMPQIVNLLSWKFLKSVLLANLLAWPIAWYALDDWLSNFAYRIDIGISAFLLPGLIALVIAWVTVAVQAWIVVRNNPIHALRYE